MSISSECSTSNILDSAPFVTRQSEGQGEVTSDISDPWDDNAARWEPWKYFLHPNGHLSGKVASFELFYIMDLHSFVMML